jgi:hypothetical protein
MTESEALAQFHKWADARRQPQQRPIAPIVAFLVRYWLGCLLLWISSGCLALARIVAPAV